MIEATCFECGEKMALQWLQADPPRHRSDILSVRAAAIGKWFRLTLWPTTRRGPGCLGSSDTNPWDAESIPGKVSRLVVDGGGQMTCIVGLVHEGVVYIGGDSAGVAGLSLVVRADEKVLRNGDFLMGFTTSFRMGQLLRYKLDPPRRHPDDAWPSTWWWTSLMPFGMSEGWRVCI